MWEEALCAEFERKSNSTSSPARCGIGPRTFSVQSNSCVVRIVPSGACNVNTPGFSPSVVMYASSVTSLRQEGNFLHVFTVPSTIRHYYGDMFTTVAQVTFFFLGEITLNNITPMFIIYFLKIYVFFITECRYKSYLNTLMKV